MRTIEIIQKEQIRELVFSRREVLKDPESRKFRYSDLHRAQILGNLFQSKVIISFESAEGLSYQVNTTVWALGSQFITLKGGVVIPINCIVKIE